MTGVRITCVALTLLALAGCRGDSAADEVAGFTPLPRGEAAAASRALADAGVDEAIRGAREVAERGGVRIDTRRELLGYAFDARRKATQTRLDSNEFAQMLLGLGFPFGDMRASTPADGSQAMRATVEREDREDVDAQMRAVQEAERASRRVAEDAARERHEARVDALEREPRERYRAAMEVLDELSRAQRAVPREERAALAPRLDAARREREAAMRGMSEVKSAVRGLRSAFEEERRALAAQRRREDGARTNVGPNHEAGRQLMELLAAWVRAAAEDPEHPDSFVPLYLAEMARRQADPIDLALAPRADLHQWNLLEMALFVAAFQPAAEPPAGSLTVARVMDFLLPVAYASSPCEAAKKALGDWGDVAESGSGQASSQLLDLEFKRLWGDEAAKQMGKAISATAIVGKIIKLAAFYAHTQVTVDSDVSEMHKPLGGHRLVTFTARAGVSPEEFEAYEKAVEEAGLHDQAVRDCLGWAGLPASDSIKDVARDAENWVLDWRLQGDGTHATWSPRENRDARFLGWGRVGKPMQRVSPTSTESRFVIRVLPEPGHAGPLGTARVVVRAEVDSSGLPSLDTLANAAKGVFGLAESVVDIAAGWTRVVFKPKAYAVIELEFHCPNPTTIHRYVTNPVASGNGDGGEGCTFHFDTREDFEEWREEHGR